MININGYKKLARKCPKRITYMHIMHDLQQKLYNKLNWEGLYIIWLYGNSTVTLTLLPGWYNKISLSPTLYFILLYQEN